MSGHETVDPGQVRRIADRYRLTGVLGSGGAGTVWAAVDEVLGREVAVKDVVIPPWMSDQERAMARERTLREARAACRIEHPNVVDIYDVVEQDGRPWIVMRLLKAPSLAEVIEREGPCSPAWAARIGLQVLSALRAAHSHGIMHRDVKPSNVMVDRDRAILTDFGIATIDGESTLTSPDALVGAPSYIAPERVRGEPATPSSDLWSLGATLYAIVEGHPPHVREGVLAILTAVATDDPDPVERAGALAPLLSALLRKDPGLRPDAADVEQHLRRVIALTDDPSATTATGARNAAEATTTISRIVVGERIGERTGDRTGGRVDDPTASNPIPLPPPAKARHRKTPVLAGVAALLTAFALAGLLLFRPDLPGEPQGEPTGGTSSVTPAPSSDGEAEDDPAGVGDPVRRPANNPGPSPSQETTSDVAPEPTTEEPAEPTPTGTEEPPPPTTTDEPPPTTTDEPEPTTAETSDPATEPA